MTTLGVSKEGGGAQTGVSLWMWWVGANALAEFVGLGATLALDALIVWQVASRQTVAASVVAIALMTATGAVEGMVVGLWQWSVLRRSFANIKRRAWVWATVVGALVAWFLGSLPSTLMDMGAQQSAATMPEPELATVLLLAVGMGLVLGAVLAYPQWRVLRRAVEGAWLWVPANSLAWAVGMAGIFATIDVAQAYATAQGSLSTVWAVLIVALGLLISGALVGAVHGVALVRLARKVEST